MSGIKDGTVRYPGYKGIINNGLRNKRKAHWAKIRKEELYAKIAKERAKERAEYENQFNPNDYNGWDH